MCCIWTPALNPGRVGTHPIKDWNKRPTNGCANTLQTARDLAPHNSATTLQVAAGIVGALAWMLDHPRAGITEAEAMDSDQVLAVALPYLGHVGGTHTHWRPGPDWLFQNFIAPFIASPTP